ncbi:MAG: hypothetical protein AAGA32_09125 [Pseudomonadota bacterium]
MTAAAGPCPPGDRGCRAGTPVGPLPEARPALPAPFELRIDLTRRHLEDARALVSGVERIDAGAVRVACPSCDHGMRTVQALAYLSAGVLGT